MLISVEVIPIQILTGFYCSETKPKSTKANWIEIATTESYKSDH